MTTLCSLQKFIREYIMFGGVHLRACEIFLAASFIGSVCLPDEEAYGYIMAMRDLP